jgi:hypothetical protein
MELFSGETGLWSVAEEAFSPEARSRGQWLLGGFLLRRPCYANVAVDRLRGVVATLQFLEHKLA